MLREPDLQRFNVHDMPRSHFSTTVMFHRQLQPSHAHTLSCPYIRSRISSSRPFPHSSQLRSSSFGFARYALSGRSAYLFDICFPLLFDRNVGNSVPVTVDVTCWYLVCKHHHSCVELCLPSSMLPLMQHCHRGCLKVRYNNSCVPSSEAHARASVVRSGR